MKIRWAEPVEGDLRCTVAACASRWRTPGPRLPITARFHALAGAATLNALAGAATRGCLRKQVERRQAHESRSLHDSTPLRARLHLIFRDAPAATPKAPPPPDCGCQGGWWVCATRSQKFFEDLPSPANYPLFLAKVTGGVSLSRSKEPQIPRDCREIFARSRNVRSNTSRHDLPQHSFARRPQPRPGYYLPHLSACVRAVHRVFHDGHAFRQHQYVPARKH